MAVFPYQDPHLSTDQRVADLMERMSIEDKAGLMFHTMVSPGDLDAVHPMFPRPSARTLVVEHRITHMNLMGAAADGRAFAEWHNALQRLAAEQPLGIPVTISTDPRNHFTDNPMTAMMAGPFSQWPEPLGLAAIGDEELVERFGDIARQEYTAVGHPRRAAPADRPGHRAALGAQAADLRRGRRADRRAGAAYIRGFQGETLGPESVATMTKHFPGGGPQKDGEDPHFAYGREQVYPGGQLRATT